MILSDCDIRVELEWGQLVVTPQPPPSAYQPASLELHLDFGERAESVSAVVEGDTLTLPPNSFCLAHTVETVGLSGRLAAQVNGKSSLGRIGLLVHATAGYVDPGFTGQITLELKNLHETDAVVLRRGQPVAQLVLHRMFRAAEKPYGSEGLGSHYQGQCGTTPSYLSSDPNHWSSWEAVKIDACMPPCITVT